MSCHVVGWDRSGGYSIKEPRPFLEGVGCETCHGRGGPHLSPNLVANGNYEPVCASCHDAKHSLGFDYASFGPRVSHAANAHLLALLPPGSQRLAEVGSTRKPLFRDAAYVGSNACQGCHPAEFATWEAGPHGRSMDSLAGQGKAPDADCQRCHTTAYGQAGGFPTGGPQAPTRPCRRRLRVVPWARRRSREGGRAPRRARSSPSPTSATGA